MKAFLRKLMWNTIGVLIIVAMLGLIVLVWWLDHIRFVY